MSFSISNPIQKTRCIRISNATAQILDQPSTGIILPKLNDSLMKEAQDKCNFYHDQHSAFSLVPEEEKNEWYLKLKELKKQACENISLCRSLNSRRIDSLEKEINDSILLKVLSVVSQIPFFNGIFRSIFSSEFETLEIPNRLRSNNNKLLKKQNEILKKHAKITNQWRPNKSAVTKESLIQRIQNSKVQATLQNVLDIYNAKTGENISLDSIIEKLRSIKFSKFELGENELMTLNNSMDLIVTDKNNYYLVFKDMKLGKGGSKCVYPGLDLTKNRAIALGYIEDKNKAQSALENEENTYCEITGKDLSTITEKAEEGLCTIDELKKISGLKNKIELKNNTELENELKELQNKIKNKLKKADKTDNRNSIIKHIDFLEFKNKSIFVSELYCDDLENHLNVSNITENDEISLCKEAIDLILRLFNQNIIFMDLKASNLFIDNAGHLRFGDIHIRGYTRAFLPPELAQQYVVVDNKYRHNFKTEDYKEPQLVWALGLVLFHILFRKDYDFKLKEFVKKGNPTPILEEFLDSLKPSLTPLEIKFFNLVEQMIKENPKERLTLEQAQQEWEEIMVLEKLIPERPAHSDEPSFTDLNPSPKDLDFRLENRSVEGQREAGSQYIHFSEIC